MVCTRATSKGLCLVGSECVATKGEKRQQKSGSLCRGRLRPSRCLLRTRAAQTLAESPKFGSGLLLLLVARAPRPS